MDTPDPTAHASQPGPPPPGVLPPGPPGALPPGAPPPGWGYYPPRRPTNSMALAALVVGLVSLFSCPLVGAVAVYLGNRARAEIRVSGEDGDGLAQAGVIVGWCAVGLTVLYVLFIAGYFAIFAGMVAGTAGV